MFASINWLYTGLIAAFITAIAGTGFYIHHQGYVAGQANIQAQWNAEKAQEKAAIDKQRQADQDTADKLQARATAQINALDQQNLTLQKRLQDEISSHDVYHTCLLTVGGVRAFNSAISAP